MDHSPLAHILLYSYPLHLYLLALDRVLECQGHIESNHEQSYPKFDQNAVFLPINITYNDFHA